MGECVREHVCVLCVYVCLLSSSTVCISVETRGHFERVTSLSSVLILGIQLQSHSVAVSTFTASHLTGSTQYFKQQKLPVACHKPVPSPLSLAMTIQFSSIPYHQVKWLLFLDSQKNTWAYVWANATQVRAFGVIARVALNMARSPSSTLDHVCDR